MYLHIFTNTFQSSETHLATSNSLTRKATRNRNLPHEHLHNYCILYGSNTPRKVLNNTGFTHPRSSLSLRQPPSNATEQSWDYLIWRSRNPCCSNRIRTTQSPKTLSIANHRCLSQPTTKKNVSRTPLLCFPRSSDLPSQLAHLSPISLSPFFCSSLTSNSKTENPHKISLPFFTIYKKTTTCFTQTLHHTTQPQSVIQVTHPQFLTLSSLSRMSSHFDPPPPGFMRSTPRATSDPAQDTTSYSSGAASITKLEAQLFLRSKALVQTEL
jgi:hypothetical protein